MPGYKAHIGLAIFLYAIVFIIVSSVYKPSLLYLLELAFCTVLGALFPDVDIKSKGQKYIYTAFFIGAIPLLCMRYYMVTAFLGWLFVIPMIVKHRGVFHDPVYMSLLVFILWYMLYAYSPYYGRHFIVHYICFLIGMHSHMLLDYGIVYYVKKVVRRKKRRKKLG